MAKEFFLDWNPRADSLELVRIANAIVREFMAQGYVLTLRQLYYQFVSKDLIPNSEKSYKNLGNVITKARMAGMIDWEAIEDRNREHKSFYSQENELDLINGLPEDLVYDQWARQEYYIEVWVEKEALGNVISKACRPWRVPYMSCKGYLSASEAYRAGKRFDYMQNFHNKKCIMIHLGDHDPSGIDMTRDNDERIELFSRSYDVEVQRIALNYDQIEEHEPPPNPTKVTDSRAKSYMRKHGNTSWELDALPPKVLVELIQNQVKGYIDFDMWVQVKNEQEEKREMLRKLASNWDEVKDMLDTL